MKRIISILASLFCVANAFAQDIIVRTDGVKIEARIVEINKNDIIYNTISDPEGQTYAIGRENVAKVIYKSEQPAESALILNGINYTDRAPITGIQPNLRYSDIKSLYDVRDYVPVMGDRYNPGSAGMMSFLIPGLGQIYCGEPLRGAAFLIGTAVPAGIGLATAVAAAYSEPNPNQPEGGKGKIIASGFFALSAIMYIISITDAVHVAKVKDMYKQDIRKTYEYDVRLSPAIDCVKTACGIQPTVGLGLAINF